MFETTSGKGFHITFANGWTASVQWGVSNYRDGYSPAEVTLEALKHERLGRDAKPSPNAEIAAWSGTEWHTFPDGQEVRGYQSPEQVLAFMNEIAAKGGES